MRKVLLPGKLNVLLSVLAVSLASAGEVVSVGGVEPPTEYNAQWNLFRQGEVRCDREGLNVYGCNDCATLWYRGQPINLHGYDGVLMSIVYMQDAADSGDYCELYLGYDNTHYTLFHTFEDKDGPGYASLMLDGYYGVRDLEMKFKWVSDSTGVARGFRLYSIEITGVNWGEGEYANLYTWDSDEDVTGHQSIGLDWMVVEGNMSCLSFEYGTDSDAQGWWALDNVELIADGESVLPLQAGGYGVEDFESGGWYQDQHGLAGEWETDTDRATGDMSGVNWQCDSAAHPGSPYQAETLTPWMYIGNASMISLEFDTWYHPGGPGEYASLGVYSSGTDERLMWLEQFENLDDWHATDDGSNLVETSWGAIKASF
jgi:hypothetical protein